MERLFDRIIDIMAFISGVISILVMILICYLVVMRYIFSNPPGWVLELCEYLLVYICFLGAPWLLKRDGHVKVDIVFRAFPSAWKRVMRLATDIIGSMACFLLAGLSGWVTWANFQKGFMTMQTLTMPRWVLFVVIPVGFLFLAIQFIFKVRALILEPEAIPD